MRRTTTAIARTIPTPMMRATPVNKVPLATWPSSKRGRMTWSITQPLTMAEATVHSANTAAPATAVKNRRGWSRMWCEMRAAPRRHGDRRTGPPAPSAACIVIVLPAGPGRPVPASDACGMGMRAAARLPLRREPRRRGCPRAPPVPRAVLDGARLQQVLRSRRHQGHGGLVQRDRDAPAPAERLHGCHHRARMRRADGARFPDATRRRRHDRPHAGRHLGRPPAQRLLRVPARAGLGVLRDDRRGGVVGRLHRGRRRPRSTTPSASTSSRGGVPASRSSSVSSPPWCSSPPATDRSGSRRDQGGRLAARGQRSGDG